MSKITKMGNRVYNKITMKIIERKKYLNQLIDVMNTPDIKVITGIRRSGKSKLLESFMKYITKNDSQSNIIYINLESIKYKNLTLKK
mgnify:CR=1 FL=1